MKPARIALIERAVLAVGFLGMSLAIGAFDWRIGLFFGSALLSLAALDIPWRRA